MASLNGGIKFLVASKTSLVKSTCFFVDLSYRYYPEELLQNYFRSRLELILTLFKMAFLKLLTDLGGEQKGPLPNIWHT